MTVLELLEKCVAEIIETDYLSIEFRVNYNGVRVLVFKEESTLKEIEPHRWPLFEKAMRGSLGEAVLPPSPPRWVSVADASTQHEYWERRLRKVPGELQPLEKEVKAGLLRFLKDHEERQGRRIPGLLTERAIEIL